VLLAVGNEAWRPVFAVAHLAALLGLAPLGVMLVRHAVRQTRATEDGPLLPALVARYPQVVFLLAAVVLTITVSLMNFEDGIRWLRRVANLSTVAIVLVLVARYLRWARDPSVPPATPTRRGRPPARRSGAPRRR
jgi:hypothetical protein